MIRLASVLSNASLFIWASINTSPELSSTVTQAMSPSGENRGVNAAPSSRAFLSEDASSISMVRLLGCEHKGEETNLLIGILAEDSGKLRRHGRDAVFLHAAHRHAHMLGLQHDGDATRMQGRIDRMDDLRSHRLLGLQAARESVDDARQLGKTDDAAVRIIADMRLAEERHHMVP